MDYNENNNEAKSYLITPYFINETILKSDILKIEEILIEKFDNRVDKSEIPKINYINYLNTDKNKTSFHNITNENRETFNFINNNYFKAKNIYVINQDKEQKRMEFEKISENTFVKKYLIPVEALKQNKNESLLKSIYIYFIINLFRKKVFIQLQKQH